MSHNTKSCYGLQSMLQQKKMTGDWLRQILVQIVKQAEMLEKYLLDASDLVVCVEYLFFHTEKEEIRLQGQFLRCHSYLPAILSW